MGIGFGEWAVIFLIILLLFGARRLPEIARSLGKALNEFRQAKDAVTREAEAAGSDAPPAGTTGEASCKGGADR